MTDYRRAPGRVVFDRTELNKILAIYADRVARGEWRDYAIDHRPHMASFAVFRSCYEWPLFVIAKFSGQHAARQGNYVVSSGPRRLIQGRSIDEVLAVFERRTPEPV